MLGIYKADANDISHFDWWIGDWLLFIGSWVGILSFSYLTVDWNVRWIDWRMTQKLKGENDARFSNS